MRIREGMIGRRLRGAALAAVLLVGWGCSFEVAAPSLVRGDNLDAPASVSILLAGVQADFECALAHYVVSAGLLASELGVASVFQNIKEIDKRDLSAVSSLYASVTCSGTVENAPGLYRPVSTARWQADNLLRLLDGWTDAEVPTRPARIATAAAYAGYSLLLMGEGMCTSALDVGPELTPGQLFQAAEARFTRGIAAAEAAQSTDLRLWNLLGRARARHRQGKGQEAAADAAAIPLAFARTATYSTDSPRRENLVWVHGYRSRIVTVDTSYRDLAFGGVPDPRVAVIDTRGNASDAITRLWQPAKYASAAAPIAFATGAEARLIVAEARGGQEAVAIINELHARAGLPPFASTSAAAIRAQIVEERRREFFLTGHHLGDVRQYQLPLSPRPGAPVPPAYGAGVYGGATCFPLPEVERINNPNINKPS